MGIQERLLILTNLLSVLENYDFNGVTNAKAVIDMNSYLLGELKKTQDEFYASQNSTPVVEVNK